MTDEHVHTFTDAEKFAQECDPFNPEAPTTTGTCAVWRESVARKIVERDAAILERAASLLDDEVKSHRGRSPEWSNNFGLDEALGDLDDAQKCFRAEIAKLEQQLAAANQRIAEARLVSEDEVAQLMFDNREVLQYWGHSYAKSYNADQLSNPQVKQCFLNAEIRLTGHQILQAFNKLAALRAAADEVKK